VVEYRFVDVGTREKVGVVREKPVAGEMRAMIAIRRNKVVKVGMLSTDSTSFELMVWDVVREMGGRRRLGRAKEGLARGCGWVHVARCGMTSRRLGGRYALEGWKVRQTRGCVRGGIRAWPGGGKGGER
jgi:hypothetical protein